MIDQVVSVPAEAEGRRLDVVAHELLGADFSRSQVQRLLREGHITLDGGRARAALKVRAGQTIGVTLPEPEPTELVPQAMDLGVLFEDDYLIVVNKPPGLVVHPAPGHSQGTLVHGLLHHCQGGLAGVGGKLRPGIVHRLDKDTSGALVAAKSDLAHRSLVAAFAAGKVSKTYLALVWGAPPAKGKVETGIGRHPVDRKRMSSKGRHTKSAQSRWQVTRRFKAGLSLLRVQIHTGRTHQIRVHLSESGYPVALDATYGGKRQQRSAPEPVAAALKQASRQMLHALELGFSHPITGQRLNFMAPLPPDIRSVLRALEEADRA
jgi:23S rRNA pseudouridine1911/1915/1917 synthase